MSPTPPDKPEPAEQPAIALRWYLVAILPIALLFYAGMVGWLESWSVLIALFAFFLWFFSLGFALYILFVRRPRERRQ